MIIKEYKQLDYDVSFRAFFPIYYRIQNSLSLIIMFFHDAFARIRHGGDLHTIDNLNKMLQHGMEFENVNLSVDHLHNLVYISEVYYDKNKTTTDEIERLLDEENEIELCKIGFLEHIILTKKNFIHLVLSWEEASNNQSPFLLLYQDDQGWYNTLPFQTQKAMNQFIADHTKQLNKD